ncbi:hypothetical protein [Actinomadura atramentaria]|uniref:hypothetical protein n=1 Tax=Actinomadura atramentaria TaxID=1990 RepID=UPI000367245D|nr:hypothetical protein [Actinomadura atramentaria]
MNRYVEDTVRELCRDFPGWSFERNDHRLWPWRASLVGESGMKLWAADPETLRELVAEEIGRRSRHETDQP